MGFREGLNVVFRYLSLIGVSIAKGEFKNQIESHPDYPSLLSFSDALTFFSIRNSAFKISINDISDLPPVFLAVLNKDEVGRFIAYIKKEENTYIYTAPNGKEQKINLKDLEKLWTDIVLIVNDFNDFKNQRTSLKLSVYISLILANLILSILLGDIYTVGLTILIITGLYFSIEAIKVELGFDTSESNPFCSSTSTSDCSKIIRSNKGTIWSLKFSDLAIWMFSSQLLCLFIFSTINQDSFLSLLLTALILCIPVTLYSLYFQFIVAKQVCPLCIGIISTIYAEVLYLLFFSKIFPVYSIKNLITTEVLTLMIICTIVALLLYLIKRGLLNFRRLKEADEINLKYLKNYRYFKQVLLLRKKDVNFAYGGLNLGSIKSNLVITLVISPYCLYCKQLAQSIYRIYDIYKETVNFKVRFNFPMIDEEIQELGIQLHRIYREEGEEEFLEALNAWFEILNLKKWFKLYKKEPMERTQIINDIVTDNWENRNNKILFTPYVLVNNYIFPEEIEKSYIINFLPELIEDKDICNPTTD